MGVAIIHSKKLNKSWVATLTAVAFFVTSLQMSPLAFANETRTKAIAKIQIPMELGTIDEAQPGTNGQTVVYIQDAHDSLEAQENIARIIHHLVEKAGVTTVFEEGYQGVVPTDKIFNKIPDQKLRERVSYYLMDKLRMSGAEYAAINESSKGEISKISLRGERQERKDGPFQLINPIKPAFSLIGADSLNWHKKNVEKYQEAIERQGAVDRDLDTMESSIRNLAQTYLPKEVKEWVALKEKWQREEIPLMGYLKRTQKLFANDPKNYPNIAKILSAESLSSNQEKIDIDAELLFAELVQLEHDGAQQLLKEDRDLKIFNYYQNLQLFRRLNHMQIREEEFAHVKNALQNFSSQEIAEFISKQTNKSVILSKEWQRNLRPAVEFYDIAQKRERIIEKSLRSWALSHEKKASNSAKRTEVGDKLNENPKKSYPLTLDAYPFAPSVLVFGGFHKEGIKRMLAKNGFGYYVVTPKISRVSPRHQGYYKQLMKMGYDKIDLPGLNPTSKATAQSQGATPPRGFAYPENLLADLIAQVLAAAEETTSDNPESIMAEMDLALKKIKAGLEPAVESQDEIRAETRTSFQTTGGDSKNQSAELRPPDVYPFRIEDLLDIHPEGFAQLILPIKYALDPSLIAAKKSSVWSWVFAAIALAEPFFSALIIIRAIKNPEMEAFEKFSRLRDKLTNPDGDNSLQVRKEILLELLKWIRKPSKNVRAAAASYEVFQVLLEKYSTAYTLKQALHDAVREEIEPSRYFPFIDGANPAYDPELFDGRVGTRRMTRKDYARLYEIGAAGGSKRQESRALLSEVSFLVMPEDKIELDEEILPLKSIAVVQGVYPRTQSELSSRYFEQSLNYLKRGLLPAIQQHQDHFKNKEKVNALVIGSGSGLDGMVIFDQLLNHQLVKDIQLDLIDVRGKAVRNTIYNFEQLLKKWGWSYQIRQSGFYQTISIPGRGQIRVVWVDSDDELDHLQKAVGLARFSYDLVSFNAPNVLKRLDESWARNGTLMNLQTFVELINNIKGHISYDGIFVVSNIESSQGIYEHAGYAVHPGAYEEPKPWEKSRRPSWEWVESYFANDRRAFVLTRAENRTSIEPSKTVPEIPQAKPEQLDEESLELLAKQAGVKLEMIRTTKFGIYGRTVDDDLRDIISFLPNESEMFTLFDAGSGQGIFAIALALVRPNARIIGVEGDRKLYNESIRLRDKAIQWGWVKENQIEFYNGNFNSPKNAKRMKEADFVYHYSGTEDEEAFKATLETYMKPSAKFLVLELGRGYPEALELRGKFVVLDEKRDVTVLERRSETRADFRDLFYPGSRISEKMQREYLSLLPAFKKDGQDIVWHEAGLSDIYGTIPEVDSGIHIFVFREDGALNLRVIDGGEVPKQIASVRLIYTTDSEQLSIEGGIAKLTPAQLKTTEGYDDPAFAYWYLNHLRPFSRKMGISSLRIAQAFLSSNDLTRLGFKENIPYIWFHNLSTSISHLDKNIPEEVQWMVDEDERLLSRDLEVRDERAKHLVHDDALVVRFLFDGEEEYLRLNFGSLLGADRVYKDGAHHHKVNGVDFSMHTIRSVDRQRALMVGYKKGSDEFWIYLPQSGIYKKVLLNGEKSLNPEKLSAIPEIRVYQDTVIRSLYQQKENRQAVIKNYLSKEGYSWQPEKRSHIFFVIQKFEMTLPHIKGAKADWFYLRIGHPKKSGAEPSIVVPWVNLQDKDILLEEYGPNYFFFVPLTRSVLMYDRNGLVREFPHKGQSYELSYQDIPELKAAFENSRRRAEIRTPGAILNSITHLQQDVVFTLSAESLEKLERAKNEGDYDQWLELLGLKLLNEDKLHIVVDAGEESRLSPRISEFILKHKNVYLGWGPRTKSALPKNAPVIQFEKLEEGRVVGADLLKEQTARKINVTFHIFDGAFMTALRFALDPKKLADLDGKMITQATADDLGLLEQLFQTYAIVSIAA